MAAEWTVRFSGLEIAQAYSQNPDELTLALAGPDADLFIVASVAPGFRFLYDGVGARKSRKNVADLFDGLVGAAIDRVEMADRDRVMLIWLRDGSHLSVLLFGPRPNVFHVDSQGVVADAFKRAGELKGEGAPATRPAPAIESLADFDSRCPDTGSVAKAATRVWPFFDSVLGAELACRLGMEEREVDSLTADERASLFAEGTRFQEALEHPEARIYWRGDRPVRFSLVPLKHLEDVREEVFDSVSKAVSVFVRRSLASRNFSELYDPVAKRLNALITKLSRQEKTMSEQLKTPSRADDYEKFGHLLMAAPQTPTAGQEAVALPDIFADGTLINIPVTESKTAVENATRYYERARSSRKSRETASERYVEVGKRLEELDDLKTGLDAAKSVKEVRDFLSSQKSRLNAALGSGGAVKSEIPYRRYVVEGFEIWVGKNAKQNDQLTLKAARKYDFWLHARGVPGSHVVLRRSGPNQQVPKYVKEAAASIAAFYSDAKHSALVPVVITEKKHVRKPKGAHPGAVLVSREKVLMVEPGRPDVKTS